MSRLVKVPAGKEIKPLIGQFMLKGGKTYELQPSWVLPEVYTDGSAISSKTPALKVEEVKEEVKEEAPAPKPAKSQKSKAKKRVKNTTTEAPKVELPKEEDNDA